MVIDYLLDNAGFELFTDLCLMQFLTHRLMPCTRIRIHFKSYPWFVSDVIRKEFMWMMDHLKGDSEVRDFANMCSKLVRDKKWEIVVNYFCTMPYDFCTNASA